MPIALPAAFFLLAVIGFSGSWTSEQRDPREAFLRAAVVCGVLIAVLSEGLGLLGAINRLWLSVSWGLLLLASAALAIRSGALTAGLRKLRSVSLPASRWERLLIAGLVGIVLILLIIAWISPPNNVDSLIYHMTRVVHWAQNGSLDHYPATQDHQLLKPPWAEMAILHLRVLWGSDRPANLVQWFSMVGSLIGVTQLASMLGVSRKGQLVAAAFAASVPMGILQATSTQNDYVVAFWVVCLAYWVLLAQTRPLSVTEMAGLAATVGLGTLTKGTFFVYVGPLVGWYLVMDLFRRRVMRVVAHAIAIAASVVLLNLGFWARNYQTFGGPYGTPQWLAGNLWFDALFVEGGEILAGGLAQVSPTASSIEREAPDSGMPPAANPLMAVGERASDLVRRELRMMGLNLTAPVGFVQQLFLGTLRSFPSVFDEGYANMIAGSAWNHEDTAGNPLHLALVPISLFAVGMWGRRRPLLIYAAVSLMTYALVPVVIGHGASRWAVRYQLPFFVLWSPVAGAAVGALRRPRAPTIVAAALMFAALPWLFLNNMRPVIGMPPWPTATDSIFTATKSEMLFATNPGLRDDYQDLTEIVAESGCRSVGLRLETSNFEYPFWWLLKSPESGVQLELINAAPHTGRYLDPSFQPCAVICSICKGRMNLGTLHRIGESDSMSLFMGSD